MVMVTSCDVCKDFLRICVFVLENSIPLPDEYVQIGDVDCNDDYIMIPGGSQTGKHSDFTKDRFCGSALGFCSSSGNGDTCNPTFGAIISRFLFIQKESS